MLPLQDISIAVQVALVAVPVATYFLVLGLLNSRAHPQLLSGGLDFAMLILALAPLVGAPALMYFGGSIYSLVAIVSIGAVIIAVLAPRKTWVIYNLSGQQGPEIVYDALRDLGIKCTIERGVIDIPSRGKVYVSSFSPLRNVTVRVKCDDDLYAQLGHSLGARLAEITAQTSNMAMSLLLVATAMMVAPLSLVAHRVPEIVRIIGDLLP